MNKVEFFFEKIWNDVPLSLIKTIQICKMTEHFLLILSDMIILMIILIIVITVFVLGKNCINVK